MAGIFTHYLNVIKIPAKSELVRIRHQHDHLDKAPDSLRCYDLY